MINHQVRKITTYFFEGEVKPLFLILLLCLTLMGQTMTKNERPRARDLGLSIGVLPTGTANAITDVPGVQVGHTTLVRGETIRTGVTAILPHPGNLFREKVPGAVFIGNAFGKLAGSTQVNELGEIETPILLTSTLNVPRVADALIDYMIALPGNEDVQSINPLVGETNDGFLNDIRNRPVGREEVFQAIKSARGGAVEEGSVGAGTGTVAFGFKGGIGTASRKIPSSMGGYTVGVLVQSNFGGVLTIAGAPVGRDLGRYYLKEEVEREGSEKKLQGQTANPTKMNQQPDHPITGKANRKSQISDFKSNDEAITPDRADGSIIIVIATDAPLDERNLRRLAARAMLGLARTGSSGSNGSGDYAIAFSTAQEVRIKTAPGNPNGVRTLTLLPNNAMSPLFEAVIEATEEAIYNSLFRASTITGRGRTVEALPIDKTVEILKKYNVTRMVKNK
jgi:D-aminopeptidase